MHRFEEDIKQRGREALRKAVDSRVFESGKFADGHEAKLVNKLIEIIMRDQQHDFQPCLPMNLVTTSMLADCCQHQCEIQSTELTESDSVETALANLLSVP
ncbi:hypothetical protein NL676_013906 [Syzygium grande]|nr:hypothetical protein NL676_013906 [Syzygium grande]